ncbi:Clavaminate synthase-like protein [Leucogyrophana mollusca]|uniref:Clavaminate synthase-like protein n=1 Tax=Leucogyrophana mollusca TaxID=85980 RepID=A0ACB8BMY6_9AGAM|nr:Clavaminate synthase-like protein [Leucogyrophana mollusca]
MADLVEQLLSQLNDDKHPCTVDLNKCGPDITRDFTTAAQSLLDNVDCVDASRMDVFIQLAYQKLTSLPQSRSLCWRRLYTDACIFKALVAVTDPTRVGESTALETIATLDHAIIIAGAAGEGRLALILSLVREVQSIFLSTPSPDVTSPDFCADVPPRLPNCPTSCGDILCISPPPSFTAFQNCWAQTPFILRNYISDWPAMTERPWASVNYLRSIAGPGRIVPVEVGEDYRSDDWTQELINWDTFLSSLDPSRPRPKKREVLYLAQHNLMAQFPALRDDIVVPDYVYSCLAPPRSFPGYTPPGNEEQFVINAWLGPKGTISPAHTDPFFNCYAQVVGRKTVWLAPPDVSKHMYPYSAPASDTADKTHNPAANTTNPLMSNTSRVDVFPSSDGAERRSKEEFPAFWENVPKKASCAILEAGDLLVFPPGWWHAMRSEETSFSVSMWF